MGQFQLFKLNFLSVIYPKILLKAKRHAAAGIQHVQHFKKVSVDHPSTPEMKLFCGWLDVLQSSRWFTFTANILSCREEPVLMRILHVVFNVRPDCVDTMAERTQEPWKYIRKGDCQITRQPPPLLTDDYTFSESRIHHLRRRRKGRKKNL